MPTVSQKELTNYVRARMPDFHKATLENLRALPLMKVVGGKNPYSVKNLITPRKMVKDILDDHLSKEETIHGGFLKGLAIFVCEKTYGAHGKSNTAGVDVEFDKDGKHYIVTIKSGPNWDNRSQIAKMKGDFKTAAKVYRQSKDAKPVVCINGCCYGKQRRPSEDKGDYVKLCGQRFWEFISGDPELYIKIVEPIGHKAIERNTEFLSQYELVLDKFTEIFRMNLCDEDNNIQWDKLTKIASEAPLSK